MLKKSSQVLFRCVAVISLILAASSAYLIHKEHETLSRLLNPGGEFKTTDVYSRWLDLKTSEGPTWDRVVGWLGLLGYRLAPSAPAEVGEYHSMYPTLTVFVRPFTYPDKELPAQLLELHFSDQRLDHIEALSGHAALEEWRLEPARLAQWASGSKTARVQVKVSDLPPYVPRAVIAIEDKRFFEHGAFDAVGIARALLGGFKARTASPRSEAPSASSSRALFFWMFTAPGGERFWRRLSLCIWNFVIPNRNCWKCTSIKCIGVRRGQDSLIGIESREPNRSSVNRRVR